jgi:tRNA(Ile)-lysidine synthase
MNEIIKQYLYKSIDFEKPLILCVSGGKDSICMFHLVMSHRYEFKNLPEVIHFNHGLRKESRAEEGFIKKLCEKYSISCKIFKLNVKEYAANEKLSPEEAARLLRYKALTDYTNKKGNTGYVFTAHTASDQLETIIFRLIKGTGRSGLAGIRKKLDLPSGWIVRRPILQATTDEIMQYINDNDIKFCTDKSNFDVNIPRNFIRHRIVKFFKNLNPSIEKSITKEVSIWSQEEGYLNKEVNRVISEINVEKKGSRIYVALDEILNYNNWLRRRVLKRLSPVELNFNKTDALVEVIFKTGSSSYIELGGGWNARKEYKSLVFEKAAPELKCFEYSVIPGKDLYISEIKKMVKMELIENYIDPVPERNIEIFDADKLNINDIKVRSRKKGDKIEPMGVGGIKKIKDIYVDLKLPLAQRNNMAVFVDGKSVLWAAPYRRSSIAPITEQTKRVVRMEIN